MNLPSTIMKYYFSDPTISPKIVRFPVVPTDGIVRSEDMIYSMCNFCIIMYMYMYLYYIVLFLDLPILQTKGQTHHYYFIFCQL